MMSGHSANPSFFNEKKKKKKKIERPEHSLTPTPTSDKTSFFPYPPVSRNLLPPSLQLRLVAQKHDNINLI